MMSDNRKIGMGLLALGGIFLLLGVMMLFNPGLLAIGACGVNECLRLIGSDDRLLCRL